VLFSEDSKKLGKPSYVLVAISKHLGIELQVETREDSDLDQNLNIGTG
jgi:hypothetical protein